MKVWAWACGACRRCRIVSILRTASACFPNEMIRSNHAAAIAGGSRTDAPSRNSISCCCKGCVVFEVALASAVAMVCPLEPMGAELAAADERLKTACRFFIRSQKFSPARLCARGSKSQLRLAGPAGTPRDPQYFRNPEYSIVQGVTPFRGAL